MVSDRYQIVQNEEAFAFTDGLLGEGVVYETAGALQGGRRTFILARLPQRFIIAGDEIMPYFVIMNSHDGSCSIKAAMTPVRVVCQNTLNLALRTAKRTWTAKHTSSIMDRIDDARMTLQFAEKYMAEMGKGIDELVHRKLMTGSLQQKKLASGKEYYYIKLTYIDKSTGTRRYKTIGTGLEVKNNKRKAEAFKNECIEKYSFLENVSGRTLDSKILLCDYLDKWLEDKKIDLKISTYEGYTYRVKPEDT